MTDEDECKHGMTPAFCAQCRNLSLNTEPDWTVTHGFVASYPGTCARCKEPFDEGAIIGALEDGGYVHAGCGKQKKRVGL